MSAITNPDALARIAAERAVQAMRTGTPVSTPEGNGVIYGVTGSLIAVTMTDGSRRGFTPADVHPTDARVFILTPREHYALRHRATAAIVAGHRWDSREDALRFHDSLPADVRDMLDPWPVAVRELTLTDARDLS